MGKLLDRVSIEFLRSFVRPFIAYMFSAVFAGLVVYAFVKYGDSEIAKTLIVGFVGIVGTIIGFYYGQRGAQPPSK